MTRPTVHAHVLTFGAPAELEECLRGLANQVVLPDRVLVVDNAGHPAVSSDALPSALDAVVLRAEKNEGPAGGHHHGLAAFLESGCTYAWVMDDDFVADTDCLARLLEAATRLDEPSLVWPTQIGMHGGVDNYPGWCGFLVHRDIVTRVGLPRRELVWWIEDTEYLQWRIPRSGARVVREDRAVIRHLGARKRSVRQPWKLYYETRNTVWYRVRVQRLAHPLKLTRAVFSAFLAAAHGSERGTIVSRFGAVSRGLIDGLLSRLGLRVPLAPPQETPITRG